MTKHLINAHTHAVIADAVEFADNRETRNRGLLGRDGLEPGAGLALTPCFAIHTFFMRFPIDVVFLDRYGFVQRIVHRLGPWRLAIVPGARMVIELEAGAAQKQRIREGDNLYLASPTASAGRRDCGVVTAA
jgi:uncharacterized protein